MSPEQWKVCVVGVLFDYFRAPDRETALRLLNDGSGVPDGPTTGKRDLDVLDAKGLDPAVTVGQLLALILNVPWRVGLVETVSVWPPEETKPTSYEQWSRLPEDSPWDSGITLEELGVSFRDALADVDDHALPWIAEQWTGIQEFDGHVDGLWALHIVEEFVALARRAKDVNDRLYCWCCL
jgi:hypothetical protein